MSELEDTLEINLKHYLEEIYILIQKKHKEKKDNYKIMKESHESIYTLNLVIQ